MKQTAICFDTETTGVDANNSELVGISIAYKVSEAYYIPVSSNFNEAEQLVNEFKSLFFFSNKSKN